MCKEGKQYKLELLCDNCGNLWGANIPMGMDFFRWFCGSMRYEACYGKIDMWGREADYDTKVKVSCPICGSYRVKKAEPSLTEHTKESERGLYLNLKANKLNPVMGETWGILQHDLGSDYAWSLWDVTHTDGKIDGAEQICTIKGRRGKGLTLANTMIYIKPLVEAMIDMENTMEMDVHLFIDAMHKVQDLLLEAGLASKGK